eukprot:261512_1
MALCFCLFEVKSLRWILKFIWNVLELIKFNFPIDIISILSLELNGRIHGGPNVKDVLYSNDEALYDNINGICTGQHCYCYTDSSKHETVKSIYKHKSVENNIECTALEGGNYVECNENCNFANPNCYYGNGAA